MTASTTENELMIDLPAGYVDLEIVAIHVSDLREYTRDVRRFLEYLPLAKQLADAEPGEAAKVFRSAANTGLLMTTWEELGEIYLAMPEDARGATP